MSAAYNQTFKSFIGLPGGSETEKCFYPFKLDTYGRGCVSDCVYCYAKATLDWRKMWDAYNPARAEFEKIEKIFDDAFVKNKHGKLSELIRARFPIRLGGMTDCFTTAEKRHGVTLKLLKLLKTYRYPYLILTKNSIVSDDEYIEAMDKDLAYIQFSVTTPNDDLSLLWERGASKTSDRMKAASKLSENGFVVAGRICPIIPIYPDGYYSLGLFQDSKPLEVFDWSIVNLFADSGCKNIIAGFMRLNYYNNNRKKVIERLGFDLDYLFPEEIRSKNDALYFSIEEKRYYCEKLRDLAHFLGVKFSVCYDGDEAYDVFRYLWDNPNDCCDAPFARSVDTGYELFTKASDYD